MIPATTIDPSRRLDFPFRVSRAGSKKFIFIDNSGVAIDISTYAFALYIKAYAGARTNAIALTVGSGLTIGGVSNNELTATFTVANTNIKEGEYYWELYKGLTSKTYLNGKATAHNGIFDGVENDTDTIIISDNANDVVITVSDPIDGSLRSLSVEISSAQILDWHNTEVDILPAPGAGKIVRAVSIDLLCRFGTTPYTFSGGTQQITPCYGSNTSVNAGTAAGTFLTLVTSVDKIVGLGPPGLETFNHNLSLLENQKISIKHLSGGSYVGGDGTIKVLTTYFIINL